MHNFVKTAYDAGVQKALMDFGLAKEANLMGLLAPGAVGAGVGAYAAGEGNRWQGGALGGAAGMLGGVAAGGLGMAATKGGRKSFKSIGDIAKRRAKAVSEHATPADLAKYDQEFQTVQQTLAKDRGTNLGANLGGALGTVGAGYGVGHMVNNSDDSVSARLRRLMG